jgi:hypothetical protein
MSTLPGRRRSYHGIAAIVLLLCLVVFLSFLNIFKSTRIILHTFDGANSHIDWSPQSLESVNPAHDLNKFQAVHNRSRPPNSLASMRKHSNENRIDRIYFINLDNDINLDNNRRRRAFMEGWLSNQTIPFERIPGRVGDPSDTCVKGKTDPERCRGIAGRAKTEVSIIDSYNTTGLTLVFEDEWSAENITRLQESISVVPNDWDVIRFNCWGSRIPSDFPKLHVERKHELQIKKVFETRHTKKLPCNATKEFCRGPFCGGTHAMVWRGGESVQKLRKLWGEIPYNDIDCDLAAGKYNITSYCINFRTGVGVVRNKEVGNFSNIPKPRDQDSNVTNIPKTSANETSLTPLPFNT